MISTRPLLGAALCPCVRRPSAADGERPPTVHGERLPEELRERIMACWRNSLSADTCRVLGDTLVALAAAVAAWRRRCARHAEMWTLIAVFARGRHFAPT